MYSCISHLYEETSPPDFVLALFQINKDGDRVFVHLESILNFLPESNQLVFWGVVTSEASLACIVLIALSRCNRVFTRRLRLCHSHTVYRRVVRKGGREGPNRE